MKNNIIFMLVVLLIAMSTIGSFAAVTFSDVPSDHWAKSFITKMADKKIISGYFDDKTLKVAYKPDKSVTYVEAVQMIYGTLKSSGKLKSTSGLTTKYSATLKKNYIPDWAYEAVAYGLEYSIIHPDELKVFVKNGQQAYAKKVDVAVFIGKALNMNDQIDPLPVLNFVDGETIVRSAVPYVDLLVKKGIVSGDDQKRFNPNVMINRAVMATMCSKTYDLLTNNTVVVPPVTPSNPTPVNKEGVIEFISAQAKVLILKDTLGNKQTYNLNTAYAKKDGNYMSMNDLKQGDSVKLIVKANGELEGIELKSSSQGTTATDKQRIIDYISTDTRMIVVKDDKGNTEVYNLNDVNIKKDGKNISMKDLNKGDGVKLVFNTKGELSEIQVDNAVTTWEGRIESSVKFDGYYLIIVRNKDNLVLKKELRVYDNTEIKYDGKDATVSKLIEGENVSVKFVGDRAIKITVESKEVIYDGILESGVIFKEHPILKFKTNNNEIMEIEIADSVTIRRDRSRVDLDKLGKGDIATITVQYGKVVEIMAASREEKTRDEGVIKQIIIGNPSQITITTDDGKTNTYEISNDVDVEIDDKDAKLKDLDVHYEVTLRLENNKVTDIDAKKVASKNNITGEIVKVYSDYNRLTIKYFDKAENKYITRSVIVKDNTTIVSNKGEKIRLGNLSRDTMIFVDGYYDDELFIANRIIELE